MYYPKKVEPKFERKGPYAFNTTSGFWTVCNDNGEDYAQAEVFKLEYTFKEACEIARYLNGADGYDTAIIEAFWQNGDEEVDMTI